MRFERFARSLGAFVVMFLLAGGSTESHGSTASVQSLAPPPLQHMNVPIGGPTRLTNHNATVTSALMF